MTPPHPYLSARPLAVDSEYSVLDALHADNVTLVTDGIRRITETGIETVTGEHHEVDVIVYATGFHATDYLFPMTIIGRRRDDREDVGRGWCAGVPRVHGAGVPEPLDGLRAEHQRRHAPGELPRGGGALRAG